MALPDTSSTFRPNDEALSSREKSQVQVARLLFFLGAFLCLVFVPLYALTSPDANDPTWIRIVVSGLLATVAAASYFSTYVRQTFSMWVLGTVYLTIGWFIVLTAVNGFQSEYETGLLLLYAVFTVIAGLGAQSITPVLWFTGTGFLATTTAILVTNISIAEEAVLLGAMGTVAVVLGITIHRLISTRNRLEEREARLRGLANSTPGVVFQFYAREEEALGTYFVSEQAEEVLGIPADSENVYERFLENVPDSHVEEFLDSVDHALDEEVSWQFEFPFEKPSGERIWLLGTSTPAVRENEVVYNGLLLDITDRKKAENELRTAKQAAEEASEVKTAMLANMSHEVRTPLTSIIGFSELLKDQLSGRLNGYAKRTYEASKQLSQTLRSILQLSKLEAGVVTLERDHVSFVDVLQETLELLESRAKEESITVEIEVPNEPVNGIWNEDAIRRIVRNLVENAIKFTPHGGRVDVRIRRTDSEAILEVADTGIGISEGLLPDIFEAFRQESEGLGREYEGSGLGLSIVNHLVQEHRGTIDVETEKGEGTRFTVRLPRANGDEVTTGTATEAVAQ